MKILWYMIVYRFYQSLFRPSYPTTRMGTYVTNLDGSSLFGKDDRSLWLGRSFMTSSGPNILRSCRPECLFPDMEELYKQVTIYMDFDGVFDLLRSSILHNSHIYINTFTTTTRDELTSL